MKTILVSGVGTIIGYGVVRSLRQMSKKVRIVGMDTQTDAAGQEWCDIFEQAVPLSDPSYIAFLSALVKKHSIDLVIPCFPQDVSYLAANRECLNEIEACIVLNRQELINESNDKWQTYNSLSKSELPCIPTRICGNFTETADEFGIPFLIKPRRSSSSKGIQLVSTEDDFIYWKRKLGSEFMAQKIIGSEDEEYTIGVFGLGDGTSSQNISLLRRLSAEGSTVKARLVQLAELNSSVNLLVDHFKPDGPTNFQFRRDGSEYLLLEINARISSSTSIRTALGYNEAEMCIEYYLEKRRPRKRKIYPGRAVRYIEDLISYDCDPG